MNQPVNCPIFTKANSGIAAPHQFTIPLEYSFDFYAGMQELPNLAFQSVTVLGCICGAEKKREVSK